MAKNSTKVIMHELSGVQIGQRKVDGYINATAMCKAGGKFLGGYLRAKSTKEYLRALSDDMQICISSNDGTAVPRELLSFAKLTPKNQHLST